MNELTVDTCPWCQQDLNVPPMTHFAECPLLASSDMETILNGVQLYIQDLGAGSESPQDQ